MSKPTKPSPENAQDIGTPRYRSGAVARMVRMPVATLRVWERRYRLSTPATSPSGQRLYTAAEVQRLALLKQLVDLGHAIGQLAGLDMAQLQTVAATHASQITAAAAAPAGPTAEPSWAAGLAVVGLVLARRLQRPALRQALGPATPVLGPYPDLASAAQALENTPPAALLVQLDTLPPGWLASSGVQAPVFAGVPVAVLYGIAAEAACEPLAAAGIRLLREPQGDTALAQWLRQLPLRPNASPGTPLDWPRGPDGIPPRRWDTQTLAELAGLSTTIACECPQHLADLVLQLLRFEDYSAQCADRSAADAKLHGYLRQVVADARASVELALERVVHHEGLLLHRPPG